MISRCDDLNENQSSDGRDGRSRKRCRVKNGFKINVRGIDQVLKNQAGYKRISKTHP